jgi:hypothetical protein
VTAHDQDERGTKVGHRELPCMARRDKKPVIPEPTPGLLGWTITVGPSDSRRSHGFQGLGGLTYQKAAPDCGERGEAAGVADPSEATLIDSANVRSADQVFFPMDLGSIHSRVPRVRLAQ